MSGRVGKEIIFWICILVLPALSIHAQEVAVSGYFLKDSIKIGEKVPYVLKATYPRHQDLIFPDSTYDFSPFEYFSRNYFPTVSDSLVSFDSVIYQLMTFEIDTVQFLQMPVYIKQEEDSAAIYSRIDSVNLNFVIREIPDSLNLKENTALVEVPGLVNYPVILVLTGFLILLLIVVILIFGKRISRMIQVYLMERQYKKFVNRFYHQIGVLGRGQAGVFPEHLLADWKKYMETLEKEPYTKMTSKELIRLHADQRLKENLRSIDRYIYGNVKDRPVQENFEKLLEYSKERYVIRIEEVRHG
jgi:hypothetical protein